MQLKKLTAVTIMAVAANTLFAQAHFSSEAHEGPVTKIAAMENNDSSFMSSSEDGFLIKWNDSDNLGEHYQVSDMPVKMISRAPNGNEVAVYESDGLSINRISVWDWKNFKRKYAKRIPDTVTSINYSAKGNYLIIGTSALNGVYILNASSGEVIQKPDSMPGLVSCSTTSSSEKTAVMYSASGSIVYYSLSNAVLKAKFQTVPQLEQSFIFGSGQTENCFLAGIKNNTLYIINAMNGKVITQVVVSNGLVFASKTKDETGVYFTSFDGKNYLLKTISFDELLKVVNGTSRSPEIETVKTFTGPKGSDGFTSAAKHGSTIMFGSKAGNLYKLDSVPEAEPHTMFPITENMYEHIYDIAAKDSELYALSKKGIYKTQYTSGSLTQIANNSSQTNFVLYNNGAILWSKDSRKTVQFLDFASSTNTTLFVPENKLQGLKVYKDKIIYILGSSEVYSYDMNTKSKSLLYTGSSIQDAVLFNNSDVYISKTSAVEPKTPLIQVNYSTKETVPVKMSGTVAYSMSYEQEADSLIYGVSIIYDGEHSITKIFSFEPGTQTINNLLAINDEDANAFTALSYPVLFTNIGKTNIRSYNLKKNTNFLYTRSASMPVKVASYDNTMAVLNRNGSISWYNIDTANVLADWYLTSGGEWISFD